MKKVVDNSFYHQNLQGVKVLVLVPHQDDEINVAGNNIKNFNDFGAEVHVCYSTNGDYVLPAEVRIGEAVAALKILGCLKENIHFLGYADSLNNNNKEHIFYSKEKVVVSASGHKETYAALGYHDYSFQYQEKHNLYNSVCYHEDLKRLILDIKADIILCVDLDTYADHRMLSLTFDDVMGEILQDEQNYHPKILKRFAYIFAYCAAKDFYQLNLLSNKKPVIKQTETYLQNIIDTGYYKWESRVRLPVVNGEYSSWIFNKTLTKALLCHKSQSAIIHAEQIINGDEIFFERKTNSLSYSARVETSSGDGKYLNDFKILGLNNIDSLYMHYANYFWQPCKEDNDKTATFIWEQPQTISKIVIYGIDGGKGRIKKIRIIFDNGFTINFNKFSANGLASEINILPQINIKWCKLQIIDFDGDEYGISECEFYNDINKLDVLQPFVKIIINDDFAYDYIIDSDTVEIPVAVYKTDALLNTDFKIVYGNAEISNGVIKLLDGDKFILRLECKDNHDIYDQIIIRRKSKLFIKYYKFTQFLESKIGRIIFRAMRKYEYLKSK